MASQDIFDNLLSSAEERAPLTNLELQEAAPATIVYELAPPQFTPRPGNFNTLSAANKSAILVNEKEERKYSMKYAEIQEQRVANRNKERDLLLQEAILRQRNQESLNSGAKKEYIPLFVEYTNLSTDFVDWTQDYIDLVATDSSQSAKALFQGYMSLIRVEGIQLELRDLINLGQVKI